MLKTDAKVAVHLWTARIPWIGLIAEHHWLVVVRDGRVDRWEVWQRQNQCADSWGHVHRNLQPPHAGVGSGPGRIIQSWAGETAVKLAERIDASPRTYPWLSKYRVFPGPNSNTFVQWAIGDNYRLGWQGIGGWYAARSSAIEIE